MSVHLAWNPCSGSPEYVFTMLWNRCSPSNGIRVHDAPEYPLKGAITEADFAADLAQVVIGTGNAEYLDPARFFANTYPTRGVPSIYSSARIEFD